MVVHSLVRGMIPGLVSHYTSVYCRIISELRVCKIIINMFESVSCYVVSFHTDRSRYLRHQRETDGSVVEEA